MLLDGGCTMRIDTAASRTILTSSTSRMSWQTISQPSARLSISRRSIRIKNSSSSRIMPQESIV